MASHQFFNHTNYQVRGSHSGELIHGRSKTQVCLHKILRIISSIPPRATPKEPPLSAQPDVLEAKAEGLRGENRAFFDVDLNVDLAPPPSEAEESQSPEKNVGLSACGGLGEEDSESPAVSAGVSTAEQSSVGECDMNSPGIEANRNGEETIEVSGVTNLQVQSSEIDNNGVSEESKGKEEKHLPEEDRSEGSLDLLVEAAKFISGEFDDGEPEPENPSRKRELRDEFHKEETRKMTETETPINESPRRGLKRRNNDCWMVDLWGGSEDVSPIVRSKRGRNQVLPCRYRDSVLEPLKRLSRQRSTTVSTKRRSR